MKKKWIFTTGALALLLAFLTLDARGVNQGDYPVSFRKGAEAAPTSVSPDDKAQLAQFLADVPLMSDKEVMRRTWINRMRLVALRRALLARGARPSPSNEDYCAEGQIMGRIWKRAPYLSALRETFWVQAQRRNLYLYKEVSFAAHGAYLQGFHDTSAHWLEFHP